MAARGGCDLTYLAEIAAAAAEKVFELGWSLSIPRAGPLRQQPERVVRVESAGTGSESALPWLERVSRTFLKATCFSMKALASPAMSNRPVQAIC